MLVITKNKPIHRWFYWPLSCKLNSLFLLQMFSGPVDNYFTSIYNSCSFGCLSQTFVGLRISVKWWYVYPRKSVTSFNGRGFWWFEFANTTNQCTTPSVHWGTSNLIRIQSTEMLRWSIAVLSRVLFVLVVFRGYLKWCSNTNINIVNISIDYVDASHSTTMTRPPVGT